MNDRLLLIEHLSLDGTIYHLSWCPVLLNHYRLNKAQVQLVREGERLDLADEKLAASVARIDNSLINRDDSPEQHIHTFLFAPCGTCAGPEQDNASGVDAKIAAMEKALTAQFEVNVKTIKAQISITVERLDKLIDEQKKCKEQEQKDKDCWVAGLSLLILLTGGAGIAVTVRFGRKHDETIVKLENFFKGAQNEVKVDANPHEERIRDFERPANNNMKQFFARRKSEETVTLLEEIIDLQGEIQADDKDESGRSDYPAIALLIYNYAEKMSLIKDSDSAEKAINCAICLDPKLEERAKKDSVLCSLIGDKVQQTSS